MKKGNLLLFVASLGIVWVHASTTSPGYCCPQITVELDTADDGTYTFLAEGNAPAMEECQNACVYAKNSNKTDLYCFKAVTSDDLGNGQVQCEAISPYSLLTSTTPAVTGPTAEDLLKKIEELQKALANQTKSTEDLEAELKKEVEAREAVEAEVGKIKTEVNSIDGMNKTEVREAVCGYMKLLELENGDTNLTFDGDGGRVYNEVNSTSGSELQTNGVFKAGAAGIYFVTLKTTLELNPGVWFNAMLRLSSEKYTDNNEERFLSSSNGAQNGRINVQASASRYVRMSAGETLHILLSPGGMPTGGALSGYYTTMCVSLYSASG